MTGMRLQDVLIDPQSLNSYSYARNNPIKNIDPNGKWFKEVITGQQSWSSFVGEVGQATQYMGSGWQFGMNHPYIPAIAGTLPLAGYGVAAGLTALSTQYLGGLGTTCIALCTKTDTINSAVNITQNGLQHVLDRHTVDGVANTGKSIFNAGENVVQLIQNASTKGEAVLQSNGNFQRVVDMGRNIGFDRAIGGQTSTMTVITNKAGELITSFPGK